MEVPELSENWGVKCRHAHYELNLHVDNLTRSGDIYFDELGRLRYCKVKAGELAGEVIFFLALDKMRVLITYQGQPVQENEFDMPPSPSTAEHFLYVIRLKELGRDYYEEFNFLPMSLANYSTAVSAWVIGEERIDVPAGGYDCWVVQTSGGWNARVWVS